MNCAQEDSFSVLLRLDLDLAQLHQHYGDPPEWKREPGFATLLQIVLEQQVSLASARAVFLRLERHLSAVTPEGFLTLDDATLKTLGFSRQKSRYVRLLAGNIVSGTLDLDGLHDLSDDAARLELLKQTGVGRWTADIYLLMALGRPDIFPAGDLALAVTVQRVKGLPARPTPQALAQVAEGWAPHRSMAAKLLWHAYLSARSKA